MFYVYVLENKDNKSWYIGYSKNLKQRIVKHNSGQGAQATKSGNYTLIYYEAYSHKQDALGREKFLKSGSGYRFLKKQLKNYLS